MQYYYLYGQNRRCKFSDDDNYNRFLENLDSIRLSKQCKFDGTKFILFREVITPISEWFQTDMKIYKSNDILIINDEIWNEYMIRSISDMECIRCKLKIIVPLNNKRYILKILSDYNGINFPNDRDDLRKYIASTRIDITDFYLVIVVDIVLNDIYNNKISIIVEVVNIIEGKEKIGNQIIIHDYWWKFDYTDYNINIDKIYFPDVDLNDGGVMRCGGCYIPLFISGTEFNKLNK